MNSLRRSQRRFSFMLATALCLWMLAVASHFHSGDYDDAEPHSPHALCAFCMSAPNTGAAPTIIAFFMAPAAQTFDVSAEIAPTVIAYAIARYYSRGPPLI